MPAVSTVNAALANYNGGGDPNYVQNVRRYLPGSGDAAAPSVGPTGIPPPPGATGATPAAPTSSPAAQQALDMITRAQQVANAFPNNKTVQDAAKRSIDYAKTLLDRTTHVETDARTRQMHGETLAEQRAARAQAEQHYQGGTLPPGYQRTPQGAQLTPGAPAPAPHTITMRDPSGDGTGIYEVTVQNGVGTVGRRLGNAPKQPGDEADHPLGKGATALAGQQLRAIAPLILSDKHTPEQLELFRQAGDIYSNGSYDPATGRSVPGLPFTPQMQQAFDKINKKPDAAVAPVVPAGGASTPAAPQAPGPSPAGSANPLDQPPIQQTTPTGSIRTAQPPTSTPQALDAYRTAQAETGKVLDAAKAFMTELQTQGGTGLNTYLDNPRDPKAIKLNQLHNRLQEALRGESFMNTGVLQPAEMQMLKERLLDPRSLRGWMATNDAYQEMTNVLNSTVASGLARKRALAGLPPDTSAAPPPPAVPPPPPGFRVIP